MADVAHREQIGRCVRAAVKNGGERRPVQRSFEACRGGICVEQIHWGRVASVKSQPHPPTVERGGGAGRCPTSSG